MKKKFVYIAAALIVIIAVLGALYFLIEIYKQPKKIDSKPKKENIKPIELKASIPTELDIKLALSNRTYSGTLISKNSNTITVKNESGEKNFKVDSKTLIYKGTQQNPSTLNEIQIGKLITVGYNINTNTAERISYE